MLPDPAFKTDPVYSPNELLINENITEFAVILMPLSWSETKSNKKYYKDAGKFMESYVTYPRSLKVPGRSAHVEDTGYFVAPHEVEK